MQLHLYVLKQNLEEASRQLRTPDPPPDMPMEVDRLLSESLDMVNDLLGSARGKPRPTRWPVPTTEEPLFEQLEDWMMDGVAYATDNCPVEPDGTCPHGHVSWLIYMGLI